MTAAAPSRARMRARPAVWPLVLLLVTAVLVVLDVVASVSAGAAQDTPSFVALMLARVLTVVAGGVLIRDDRHRGLGALLLAVGATGHSVTSRSSRPSTAP